MVLSFQAQWVGFRACVMPRYWAQISAFKTQWGQSLAGLPWHHEQLTIKFSKSVHRHSWRPGHKLQEPDPFLSIHQQNSLVANGHHQPQPSSPKPASITLCTSQPSGHNALSLLQVPSVGCSGRSYTCPRLSEAGAGPAPSTTPPALSSFHKGKWLQKRAVTCTCRTSQRWCPVLPSRTTGWRDDLGSNRFCRWCAVSSHWHRRHQGHTSVTAGKHKGGVFPRTHRVTEVICAHTGRVRAFPEYSSHWGMAAHCHNVTATSVCLAQMWLAEAWWHWSTKPLPGFQRPPPTTFLSKCSSLHVMNRFNN